MRPVHLTDLDRATRYLLTLPAGLQEAASFELVKRAKIADIFRKQTGKAHPDWGDGTLSAALFGQVLTPARRCDQAYRNALRLVLVALSRTHYEK